MPNKNTFCFGPCLAICYDAFSFYYIVSCRIPVYSVAISAASAEDLIIYAAGTL